MKTAKEFAELLKRDAMQLKWGLREMAIPRAADLIAARDAELEAELAAARELGPCKHPKMFWVGSGEDDDNGWPLPAHCFLCDREKAAIAAALEQAASVEFDEPTGCTTFVRTKHSKAAREAILALKA